MLLFLVNLHCWLFFSFQELVVAKQPPTYYLNILNVYLDPRGTKKVNYYQYL